MLIGGTALEALFLTGPEFGRSIRPRALGVVLTLAAMLPACTSEDDESDDPERELQLATIERLCYVKDGAQFDNAVAAALVAEPAGLLDFAVYAQGETVCLEPAQRDAALRMPIAELAALFPELQDLDSEGQRAVGILHCGSEGTVSTPQTEISASLSSSDVSSLRSSDTAGMAGVCEGELNAPSYMTRGASGGFETMSLMSVGLRVGGADPTAGAPECNGDAWNPMAPYVATVGPTEPTTGGEAAGKAVWAIYNLLNRTFIHLGEREPHEVEMEKYQEAQEDVKETTAEAFADYFADRADEDAGKVDESVDEIQTYKDRLTEEGLSNSTVDRLLQEVEDISAKAHDAAIESDYFSDQARAAETLEDKVKNWKAAEDASNRARSLRELGEQKKEEAEKAFDEEIEQVGEPGVVITSAATGPSGPGGGGETGSQQTTEENPNDCATATFDFWQCQIAKWMGSECQATIDELDSCPEAPFIYPTDGRRPCGDEPILVTDEELARAIALNCGSTLVLPNPDDENPGCINYVAPVQQGPAGPMPFPTCTRGLSCVGKEITVLQRAELCGEGDMVSPIACSGDEEGTTVDYRFLGTYFIPDSVETNASWAHRLLVVEHSPLAGERATA